MGGCMTFSQLTSPVVIDGIASDEKLAELLGWQTEYPELDYKRAFDVTSKEGLVEFVKDVCAFQVLGGYIVGGVDGHGVSTGEMDGVNPKLFDEASLTPKCEKYLPQPLEIRSRVLKRDGHDVVLIFIGRHPNGYAIFRTDGVYKKKSGKDYIAFRAGDSYWRNGTRSERISQQGMEAIIERRLAEAKETWLQEQQEIRRRERAEIEAAYETRRVADAPPWVRELRPRHFRAHDSRPGTHPPRERAGPAHPATERSARPRTRCDRARRDRDRTREPAR
jgi:hypothetical protein